MQLFAALFASFLAVAVANVGILFLSVSLLPSLTMTQPMAAREPSVGSLVRAGSTNKSLVVTTGNALGMGCILSSRIPTAPHIVSVKSPARNSALVMTFLGRGQIVGMDVEYSAA
ncbi:hypothetical protein C8F04DRAFT_1180697 [Mycena alexandri]|uniref:Uncharacterized protein n=1 Tax=Mycena alexandri TaxID=1745969 RepID=A0AAD6T0A2_9AGAR|nr:hypothetical protein C8F04DRAFT_1180697 [Mycena alexandri]